MIRPRKKLRTRLVIYNLSIILCVILASILFSAQYASNILRNQIIDGYSTALDLTAMHMRYIQTDISQMARIIISDTQILETIGTVESDTFDTISKQVKTSDLLMNYKTKENYIIGIDLILEEDGRIFSSSLREREGIIGNTDHLWYSDLRSRDVSSGFSNTHAALAQDRRQNVITYYSVCHNLLTFKKDFAHLLIYTDISLFENVMKFSLQDYAWAILISSDQKILCSSGDAALDQSDITQILDLFQAPASYLQYNDSTIFVNNELDDEWVLMLSVPDTIMSNQINYIYQFFLVLTTIIIIAVFITIIPLSISFTKPLENLTDIAREVSDGNLDARVHIEGNDEFSMLAEVFNDMTINLQSQMKQIMIDQREKEDLRIDLLMAQINPHFIYNTLDSIIYLSQLGRNQDACDVGRIFVRILQENLKIGPEGVIATIAEEVQSVQSYAEIQTYRYPGRFSVELNVDENTLEECVPRFLVQPIVENALFHGILPSERAGTITIDIKMKNSLLEIKIQDNGIGMSKEKVEALFAKEFVSKSAQMRSIGLYNVRERMRRIYKDHFSLIVDSSPGKGTLVSISLPTKFTD